jgi:predicted ArsR family transcriptional regulator
VDTSIEAAEAMARAAPLMRQRCLERLKLGPATADEVADFLQLSVLSVRPRITELAADGAIYDTGDRRPNASGKRAKVWSIER